MHTALHWKDFSILDAGSGAKLERWGEYILSRPDPQIIWPRQHSELWKQAHAEYIRSSKGGGHWDIKQRIPQKWIIGYTLGVNTQCPYELRLYAEPTGFKHTGIFPEQAVNWERIYSVIVRELSSGARKGVSVINLFGYTGCATAAAAAAGASVCHVDAAKSMVIRAKENCALSGLADRPVRFITDDVNKFIDREIRRKNVYDGIIMDPPSFGRGPGGEVWKFEDSIADLVLKAKKILSPNPLFFILNAYAGYDPEIIKNILTITFGSVSGRSDHTIDPAGIVSAETIGLPVAEGSLRLPCGVSAWWERQNIRS